MRILGFIARGALLLLLAVVLLAGIVFAGVQTGPGKALLARVASALASGDGLTVEVRDLSGFVPSDLRVGAVVLSDPEGVFARIEGLHLAWSPFSLLSGTVDVSALTAARAHMLRKPDLPPTPASASGGLPNLRVVVDQLDVPQIQLDAPVIGQAAQASFAGALRLMEPAQGLFLTFTLQRLDAAGSLAGSLRYAPDGAALDVDVTAQEPRGGILATLIGLEGAPELDATLKGSGTLDDWTGRLRAATGTVARMDGTATITARDGGRVVRLEVQGDISRALPTPVAPLFEGESDLVAALTFAPDGGFAVERMDLRSAGFTATARGSIPASGPLTLTFSLVPGAAARYAALIPGAAWSGVKLDGTLSGTLTSPQLTVTAAGQEVAAYGFGARTLTLDTRAIPDADGTFALAADLRADGLSASDPSVAAALGTAGTVAMRGTWPRGEEATLTSLAVQLPAVDARFTGRAALDGIDGTLAVPRLDLAVVAPFVGQPLRGVVALDAQVNRPGRDGPIAVTLTGTSRDVTTGIALLDALVAGAATVSGGVSYAPDGAVSVRDLKLGATGAALAVNGTIDASRADLTGTLALPDLTRLDPRVEGAGRVSAAFSGRLSALNVTGQVAVDEGKAMGHALEKLVLDFTATDLTGTQGGTARLTGQVGGKPARGTVAFATRDTGARTLSDLDVAIGSVTARGALTVAPDGLMTGDLAFVAGDLADISAFALTELAGRTEGTLRLDTPGGVQRVAIQGTAANLVAAGQRVANARVDLSVTDPRVSAAIQGSVDATGIEAGSLSIPQARLTAQPGTGGTELALSATAQGATITAAGRLASTDAGQSLRLATLRVVRDRTTLALTAPATFTYGADGVAVDRLALGVGGGTLTLQGRAGDTLDLTLDARALPLALAALIDPAIVPSGTLAASARITGTPAAPTGRYEISLSRATTPEITSAGAGPFDARATGTLTGGRATIAATLSAPSLSGVTVNGSLPVSQGALDLTIRGNVALGIANAILATSGARASGTAAIDATVRGTFDAPRAGGTVRISGGGYEDAINGVTLQNIQAVLTGTDRTVTLTSFRAGTRNGGSLQGQGTVTLDPAAGFPGRVEIRMDNAGLITSDLMRFVADGQITLSGPLATRPTIGGRVDVRVLDVNIPDRLPGGSAAITVRHVNVPPGERPLATLRAQQRQQARSGPRPTPFLATLDLAVNAPSRVFVRGLGMDAELGGNLQLRGTTAQPVTVGAFEVRRGRFDILGRRLDFTRGRLTFNGGLDPELDFVAESSANDVTARITITGRASQPDIAFSSTPSLPQDEVVARLLFGRPTGQLSAGQAVQVAQAVASLSGTGNSTLSALRRSLGLDALDIGADSAGTGGMVGLGRRLNDRVYLGVQQGTTPSSSRATIDIDITRNIRLQGATGADGGTSVGIGAQWDY
ncbi:MAG: hypothetical protein B7Z15_00385 [Rhizobiales bacterium 32-66-8]|nr:MAG: hypothetical protein B7Z15_00385 [Rhizobiales bacterium 32-66-8]